MRINTGRRRPLLFRCSGEEIPTESGSLEAQAAAYAIAFFSYIAPIVGPPGTGCMNNGIYSDYGQIGSNNTECFYEVGPMAGMRAVAILSRCT